MEAPALPDESSTIRPMPHAAAFATTTAAPRSLNEPVGETYSSLA